ncbi:MAG: PIN domain-containing protein [Chloroflexota bacterium]|nr:PIN domain-containing protein [Chloroflexota bacterium]
MKVLLDTNILLDFVLLRQPFASDATALWVANEQNRYEAYVSGITPVNLVYVARKEIGKVRARQAVAEILAALHVAPIDAAVLQAAHALHWSDYEDAVQHASATASGVEAIVTRNLNHYTSATIPVFSPTAFLAHLAQ